MKNFNIILSLLFVFMVVPFVNWAQSKKKANKDTFEWRYEIEANQTGVQGTDQIKVWSYSKNPETAIEQAKKNAVHGIIFKGFQSKGQIEGKRALTSNPNLEQEKEDFFKEFFQDGGKYLKYVNLVNNGAIAPGDRIKIGKEYKIGVVVSVNYNALRKDLEDAGIIKGLGSGF